MLFPIAQERAPRHPVPPRDASLRSRAGPLSVAVGLVDGTTRVGRIAAFQPHALDLALEVDARKGQRTKVLLATERIAYVGIHRTKRASSPPPASHGKCRVHLPDGKSFVVRTAPGDALPLGFYGTPEDKEGAFEELFFYEHGIGAKEVVQPIGAMLLEAGVVSPEDLSRGCAEQLRLRTASATLEGVLVEAGMLSGGQLALAQEALRERRGKRLGEILVEMGAVSEADLIAVLARKFHLSVVDLDEKPPSPSAARDIPDDVIATFRVLPVEARADVLVVAIRDPMATAASDAIRKHTSKRLHVVLALPSQLDAAIERYLARQRSAIVDEAVSIDDLRKKLEASNAREDDDDTPGAEEESDSLVVQLVNRMITDAHRQGASDIHIEPNGKGRSTDVRFRIDGDCLAYTEIPPGYRSSVVARIKILAKLDIAERRKPQDGKIAFRLPGGRPIELRVATIPTVGGNEDVVMRVLADGKPIPLAKMGMSPRNLRELEAVVTKPYGLFLCVGPTGSGKTTTLHSVLARINAVDMKIWTAEDPVEITQPGLRQVQVAQRIGLTFAMALRAFLRADPDVIMIGEMRDEETAEAAIECSLTGHLVFSTLHTNSAPETVTRLLDMGLDPFSFADALLGVLAQRLARRLCSACKEPRTPTAAELAQLADLYGEKAFVSLLASRDGPVSIWGARGCADCGHTGYKGRVGLHELLIVDEPAREAIAKRAGAEIIRRAGIAAGMTTLRQDGIVKSLDGVTDLAQVTAVCSK